MAEAYLIVLTEPVEGYAIDGTGVGVKYKAFLTSYAPIESEDTGLLLIEGANPFAQVGSSDVGATGSDNIRVFMRSSDIRIVIWIKDAAVPMDEVADAFVLPGDILDLQAVIP